MTPKPAVLEAVLERVTYVNEDTGYTVARVATEQTGRDLLTVVGALLGAQVGESLRLQGRWRSHAKYGRQFEVESYTTVLPATVQGIRRYLGSGMIKGIGPVMADRMVEHFGLDILRIIEEEPERLVEVRGLGRKRTQRIADAWEEQKAIKEVMVFLQGVGVSTSLAVRVYKQYGDASIDTVRREPYRLAADVWGIGFKTADTIAQAVGIPHDSPERIMAGLQYTLSEAADAGHCFLPEPNLITDAEKILTVPRSLIAPALDTLAEEGRVIRERVSIPTADRAGIPVLEDADTAAAPSSGTPEQGPAIPAPLTANGDRPTPTVDSVPAPDRTSPERTSPERTSPGRTSSELTSLERTSPGRTSSERTSLDRTSLDRTSSDRTSSERTSPDGTSSERTSLGRTSFERALPERALPERALPERASSDRTSPEGAPSDRTSSDRTSSDRTSSERTSSERTSSDGASLECTSFERASSGRVSAERVSAGRLPAGGVSVERASGKRAFSEGEVTVPAVYLLPFYRAERSLARGVRELLDARDDRLGAFKDVDWGKALAWLRRRTGTELAAEQEAAVRLALTSKVAVLTGGPGCGKSFTVRSVVELAAAKKAKIVLVAPTGRAAKRLAELTGHEAATIHRLLQLQPGGDAKYDHDKPLDADLVVVDESSMVDLVLANKLVKAIPRGAHLLLVGDVDQLPSVGAGEVLADLLNSEVVPRVRLTKVFRQAQESGIVVNAHRVNRGEHPRAFKDFFLFPSDDAEETAELTVDVVVNRIPRKFGLDPRRDVQVLTPMHRGPAGAGSLNGLLQDALTKEEGPEKRFGGRVFRVGDKVTQLRNNYDKGEAGVFNGTVGVVTAVSAEEHTLTVRTDEDELVDYGFDELDELTHAYAITIHRSQGSEYPAVVVPLTTNAWMMLRRNLLYTGITRAKKLVVLVGSRRALAVAVRTAGAGRRFTALAHWLA
ncbi:AAA family ATPase [Actinomadura fulvescens]|uniref:ATP-dependent RecD2 DNA helicase n=1 Tax=Actinomadura fulvescens TaxID=46160 RepID=A0ABN3Q378_9ACTN